MKIKAKELRRPYGSGGYRSFKATLDRSNYAKLQDLAPTGAGKYGSALINLAIELLHALYTGRGMGSVAQRIAASVDNDEGRLYTLAKVAMTLSLQLKVIADKKAGRLTVVKEE